MHINIFFSHKIIQTIIELAETLYKRVIYIYYIYIYIYICIKYTHLSNNYIFQPFPSYLLILEQANIILLTRRTI